VSPEGIRPRVVVVGLGPAGPELVTAATSAAIAAVPPHRRWLRTARHPSAVAAGTERSFDTAYEEEPTFDAVYRRVATELVAAATDGSEEPVLYAVPGSPRVLERTVDLVVADGSAAGVEVEVLPALSFLDLAWVRLGVDPLEEGARLVDGHRFAEAAAGERGPLLVAHCHNRRVLSDVKLAFEDETPASAIVLQRLGLPDERVVEVAWAELDRALEPDHLTSVWVPAGAPPVAAELARFDALVRTLRERCPWDSVQTHETLTRFLLEEAYEVLDAIDAGDEAHLEEELGDLLFQVVLHSAIARERGAFTLADVARGIHDKLYARHPHVFGGAAAGSAEELALDWEAMKAAEKGRASLFDGIPSSLPALLYAAKVLRKAATLGVDVDGEVPPAADVEPGDIGQALLGVVAAARAREVDPEAALRAAADRLRRRAELLEQGRPDQNRR
jgi:tetrapyrrole methylase family protein/MazG family protein